MEAVLKKEKLFGGSPIILGSMMFGRGNTLFRIEKINGVKSRMDAKLSGVSEQI
jgi:hypothetical protein